MHLIAPFKLTHKHLAMTLVRHLNFANDKGLLINFENQYAYIPLHSFDGTMNIVTKRNENTI